MKLYVQSAKTMEAHNLGNSVETEEDDISEELADTKDLPSSLIITNLDSKVYGDEDLRQMFEQIFRQYEEEATFQYFKSFRRARVNFQSPATAAKARIHCHQTKHGESIINCYFAQASQPGKDADDGYLQPPSPVRQFLISPPASPPVGWEPVSEATPSINFDLLSAISTLKPGEAHELHPATSSQPGIFVHICEDQAPTEGGKLKIMQTKCPVRKDSLESNDSPSSEIES